MWNGIYYSFSYSFRLHVRELANECDTINEGNVHYELRDSSGFSIPSFPNVRYSMSTRLFLLFPAVIVGIWLKFYGFSFPGML